MQFWRVLQTKCFLISVLFLMCSTYKSQKKIFWTAILTWFVHVLKLKELVSLQTNIHISSYGKRHSFLEQYLKLKTWWPFGIHYWLLSNWKVISYVNSQTMMVFKTLYKVHICMHLASWEGIILFIYFLRRNLEI